MRNTKLLVCMATCLVASSSAIAWKVPIRHPSCPNYQSGVSWKDYISGKIPHQAGLVGNSFGIEFRTAKTYADVAAIGNLHTDACYTNTYVTNPAGSYPKKGYSSNRIFFKGPGHPEVMHGLSGDPEKYEVNVYGVILLYNDQGEVFDFKGRPVGVLTCTARNECGGY